MPYEHIQDLYNEVCKSYPCCTTLSESRKRAIKARLAFGYTLNDFEAFCKAENRSFLKRKNERNWRINFYWLPKDANMAKTLDGLYDDADKGQNPNRLDDLGDLF